MGASTPEQRQRAADAWFMGAERNARPLTAKERQAIEQKARWAKWDVMGDWLVKQASAFVMPAGNCCSVAIEAAMDIRRRHPDMEPAAFLAAIVKRRNARLQKLKLPEFRTVDHTTPADWQ